MRSKPYFLFACRDGNERKALLHLKRHTNRCMPEYTDGAGNTALMWACINRLTKLALRIIRVYKEKCKLWKINRKGYTALMLACKYKLTKVALQLIKFGIGCNPYHISNNGFIALFIACINRKSIIANAIIKAFPDQADYTDKIGNTALILACKYNLKSTAMLLLDTHPRCKIDQRNIFDMSALHWAYISGMSTVASRINKLYISTVQEEINVITKELDTELYGSIDEEGDDNNKLKCYMCCGNIYQLVSLRPCSHIGLCIKCANLVERNEDPCPVCEETVCDVCNIGSIYFP